MSLAYTYLATNGILKSALAAQDIGASGDGAAVDVTGWKSDAAMIVNIGAGTGTLPTLSLKLQHSEDGGSTWADVPGTTVTATTVAKVALMAFEPASYGNKVRVDYTVGGTGTPNYPVSVSLLGWNA